MHSRLVCACISLIHGTPGDSDSTSALDVKFLLYNQESRLATFAKVTFFVEDSGSLIMTKSLTLFKPTPYDLQNDWESLLQLILELSFCGVVLVNIFLEIREFCIVRRKKGHCCAYFFTFVNYIDIATIVLQTTGAFMWLECISALTEDGFSPRLS